MTHMIWAACPNKRLSTIQSIDCFKFQKIVLFWGENLISRAILLPLWNGFYNIIAGGENAPGSIVMISLTP